MSPGEAYEWVAQRYPKPAEPERLLAYAAAAANDLRQLLYMTWCGACREDDHSNHRGWQAKWGTPPVDWEWGMCVTYEWVGKLTCRCPWRAQ